MLGICPRGHQLRPGRVIVGWAPCTCPPCEGRPRGLRGHRTVQCRDCEDEHVTTIRYIPEHIGGGHPNRSYQRR